MMSKRIWTTRPIPYKLEKHVFPIRTRLAAGGISQAAIAREYGVTAPAISFLVRGITYKHYPGPIYELPASRKARLHKLKDHVLEIRQRWAAGETTQVAMAREYGVTPGAIYFVVHGISYPNVVAPLS